CTSMPVGRVANSSDPNIGTLGFRYYSGGWPAAATGLDRFHSREGYRGAQARYGRSDQGREIPNLEAPGRKASTGSRFKAHAEYPASPSLTCLAIKSTMRRLWYRKNTTRKPPSSKKSPPAPTPSTSNWKE